MKINQLLFFLLLFTLISCNKEEEPVVLPIDCSTVSLDAIIRTEDSEVFKGEAATLTITGTPNSLVVIDGVTFVNTLVIGPTGINTQMVVPQEGTVYRLTSITTASGECETLISSAAGVLVKPNPFGNVILNTWNVRNDTSGSSANSVTFNEDGTGSAPGVSDSAFSQINPVGNIYSENFTWIYYSGTSTLEISYQYPNSNSTIERTYSVDEFSTTKVVLIENFGSQNSYILRP